MTTDRGHLLRVLSLAVLAACAAALMVGLRSWALRDSPLTTDENSYIFQANLFAHGKLKHPFPGCSRAFQHEMIVLDAKKGWFSRYQPGHPLWLTPGIWVGRPHAMVVLGAVLALVLAGLAAARLGAPALAMPLLLVLSPFFLFTHATLLSHTTGLLAVTALIYAYVRWKQTADPRAAALAGGAWGWLLLTRPFTAACIAPVLALDAVGWLHRDSPQRRRVGAGLIAAAATGSLAVACLLAYNALMVGSPFVMTHTFYDPTDTIGFGGPHGHTLRRGMENLWTNLVLYDRWLWGWRGSLLVAAGLAAFGWNRRWSPWLLGSAASTMAGHLLFWHPGVNDTGPVYWFETLPFVAAAATLGVGRALTPTGRVRPATAVIAAVLIAVGAGFGWREALVLRETTACYARLRGAVRTAPRNAVIMVNSSKFKFTDRINGLLVFNSRGLKSRPIVARVDSAADEAFLRRLFPNKPLFFLNLNWCGLQPLPESHAPLEWNTTLDGVAADTGRAIATDGSDTARQGLAQHDPAGWLVKGLLRGMTPGEYELEVEAETGMAGRSAGNMVVLDTTAASNSEIARTDIPSHGTCSVMRLSFAVQRVTEVEARVWFTGSSDLTLRRVTIRDRPDPR